MIAARTKPLVQKVAGDWGTYGHKHGLKLERPLPTAVGDVVYLYCGLYGVFVSYNDQHLNSISESISNSRDCNRVVPPRVRSSQELRVRSL